MKSLTQILKICIVFTGLITLTLPVSASPAGQVPPYQAKVLAEIDELKQKLVNNGDNPLIYYQIGGHYLRIFRLEDSIISFKQAVLIKPDFAVAYYRLGWIYINLRKFDEALEAHQQALLYAEIESFKLKVSKAEAQFAVGWCLYHLKRYDEAIAAYQSTLQFDSGYEDALYEIGRVQIAQGNHEQALQTASRLSPQLKAMLSLEQSLATAPAPIKRDRPTARITPTDTPPISATSRPTILYKEKAKYTERARQMKIDGVVVLNVVFAASGQITEVSVVRGLPYGLTAQAILAAQRIRFQPAVKDGQPISVRGNLEFSFNLY
ncbi:MAG: TonB family protein [Acidobacteria bacterium]|nr:TonB family protein [Acidobacteriota bacterium]